MGWHGGIRALVAGARVVITYNKDQDAAAKVCEAVGGKDRAIAVQTDVADEGAVQRLFEAAENAFGTASLLVNSAGLNMSGVMLVDMKLAHLDRWSARSFTARS